MNHETELKLQAWLDGELPEREARDAMLLVQRESSVQPLVRELKLTKAVLAGNELPRQLVESREFYWSKIKRDVLGEERQKRDPPPPRRLIWLLRFLAPAGVLALLALVLVLPALRHAAETSAASATEIESPLDDLSSFIFRSESERMTVVWVNTR